MSFSLIGLSEEAKEFERDNKKDIISTDSITDYSFDMKTITFTLKNKQVVEFCYPFRKIIDGKKIFHEKS